MSWLPLVLLLSVIALPALPGPAAQRVRQTAPESFMANAQATGAGGAAATTLTIKIDTYMTDAERAPAEQALKQGYAAFLDVLRASPVRGTVTIGTQTFNIRWAREEQVTGGRNIVLVTDRPLFFLGGANVDAKPREGYGVGLVTFRVSDTGVGDLGSMAGAAKLKVGPSGIEVEDYGEKPVELRGITRGFK